jgi:hypothetical protein
MSWNTSNDKADTIGEEGISSDAVNAKVSEEIMSTGGEIMVADVEANQPVQMVHKGASDAYPSDQLMQ